MKEKQIKIEKFHNGLRQYWESLTVFILEENNTIINKKSLANHRFARLLS